GGHAPDELRVRIFQVSITFGWRLHPGAAMHAVGQAEGPRFSVGIMKPHAGQGHAFLLRVSRAMQKMEPLRFECCRNARNLCRIKYSTAGIVHASEFDSSTDLKWNTIIGLATAGNGSPGPIGGKIRE